MAQSKAVITVPSLQAFPSGTPVGTIEAEYCPFTVLSSMCEDGASISEAAQPLLVLLNSDGSLAQNLGYVGGARHNQLTSIASLNGRWLLGGMINGPGTHSGDADRKLIFADGFLRDGSNLPAQ